MIFLAEDALPFLREKRVSPLLVKKNYQPNLTSQDLQRKKK
jgi:hypothetical protein